MTEIAQNVMRLTEIRSHIANTLTLELTIAMRVARWDSEWE